MKKIIITVLSVLLLFLASSCTSDITDPMKDFKGESWAEIFEEYWTVMDEEYAHFMYEDYDWDEIYEKYAPLFKNLDLSDENDCFKAFGYFNEILLFLGDYHYTLTIDTETDYIYEARPAMLRKWVEKGNKVNDYPTVKKQKTKGKNDYWYYSVAERKQLEKEEYLNSYINVAVEDYSETTELGDKFHNASEVTFKEQSKTVKFNLDDGNIFYKFALSAFGLADTEWFYGVTDSGVLYIYFSKFVKPGFLDCFYYLYNYDTLTPEEKEDGDERFSKEKKYYDYLMKDSSAADLKDNLLAMGKFATYFLDAVNKGEVTVRDSEGTAKETIKINGIVIDLRCNGGGAALFFQEFMGYFFASNKTVGYTQTRVGYSRSDMGPWTEYKLDYYNSNLDEDYKGRVALITNGHSVSCAELTTITSKLLPNSKRFGSTTYGATCALTSRAAYHSGEYTHHYSESRSMVIRTTTFRYKAYDGTVYETEGVVPDVEIPFNKDHDDRFVAAVKWAAGEDV